MTFKFTTPPNKSETLDCFLFLKGRYLNISGEVTTTTPRQKRRIAAKLARKANRQGGKR